MISATPLVRVARFLRGWFRGQALHAEWGRGEGRPGADGGGAWPPEVAGVRAETRTIASHAWSGRPPVRARWYVRESARRPLPGWLLLHGVAVQGPDHPALVRFAAALASSGAVAMIPEVPSWSRLDLDPSPADPIVERALEYLNEDPMVAPGGVTLAGFSFGCPQAIRLAAELGTAASAGKAPRLRGVVGFGGYCDLEAAVRFGLTGAYEHEGQPRRAEPDPYGRWVLGANYLHRTPGCEGAEEASQALRALAHDAGERGLLAWDPFYDARKSELAAPMSARNRELFRVFAPPAGTEPDPAAVERIVPLIARTACHAHPHLELPKSLDVAALPPVHLLHGLDDPLVPFTETLALERRLREADPGVELRTTVTSLFGHAREAAPMRSRPGEALRFLAAMREMLSFSGKPTE